MYTWTMYCTYKCRESCLLDTMSIRYNDDPSWEYIHTLSLNSNYFVKVYRHTFNPSYFRDVHSTWVRQDDCTDLYFHVRRVDTDMIYYYDYSYFDYYF